MVLPTICLLADVFDRHRINVPPLGFAKIPLASATVHTASPSPRALRTEHVVVDYSDLDISSLAGAQVLIERMRRAASRACAPSTDKAQLHLSPYYRTCVADALDRGVASVNSPVVAELYRGNRTLLAAK